MKAILITICLLCSIAAVSAQEETGIIWTKEIKGMGAPQVTDMNRDKKQEIVVAEKGGKILFLGALGNESFSYDTNESASSAPLLIDVNGDSLPEIVYATPSGRVSAIYPNGTNLWSYDANAGIESSPAYWNASGEILIGTLNGNISALGATGELSWSMKVSGKIEYPLSIADADKDGRTEVLAASDAGSIYDIDRRTGRMLLYSLDGPASSTPIARDINSDGKPEIVAVSKTGDAYALNLPAAGSNSKISLRWNYSAGEISENSLTVADINGDGRFETLYGSSQRSQYRGESALYALSSLGKLIKKYSTQGALVSSPLVADIDADGKKEILFGTDRGVFYILNSSLDAKMTIDLKDPVRNAPAAYDLDGNKKLEIIIAGDAALYLIGSLKDNDSDGLIDYRERVLGTDPNKADSDGDGLNDSFDPQPLNNSLKYTDSDNDGLTDYEENKRGTDPYNNDTDGDGIIDAKDPQPLVNELKLTDSDNDGLSDWDERLNGTDPGNSDTDDDGIKDGADPFPLRNELKERDSDNDTLNDYEEREMGTDPLKNDTDGDGLMDAVDPDPLHAPPPSTTTTLPKPAPGPDQTGVVVFLAALLAVLFMARTIPAGKKKDAGKKRSHI